MALGANANIVNIIIRARDQTRAAFAKAKTNITSTKAATGKLNKGLSGLSGGFSKLSSSLGSFGAALGPVGIAVAAASVAIATMGGAALKASLDFEKASATIRVGTGATGDALTWLEQSFKTVYTAVPASTADAAMAIADLNTRLGLTGKPLESLATQFLNLSRITGTDVSSAISSATRVMHDFAVSSGEQSGALDYLFKVSQSTGIEMTSLASNMTKYGGVMRQMGFDINSSAALLGKFEKEGVNLELVLSSLRMGLANFARAGEEPVDALQRVITEIQGMGSSADRNLKAIEIFGARSGPDMAAAIHEGRFSIEELMGTLEASSETINKAAADTMTFGDKWTLFKNKIMAAIVPVGDVILNVLGSAMQGLSAGFSTLQTVISTVTGVFNAFFGAIQSAVSSALAPLVERIAELQSKFEGVTGKLTIFGDIITIITAGAKWLGESIGTLLYMALTPLVDKLKAAIEMLTAFYDKLGPIKALMETGKGLVGGALEGLHDLAESTKETKEPIEELKEGLEELAEEGSEAPKAVADAWALAIKDFQEGTGSYKEAIGGIKEKITELTEEWMTATDKRKTAIENEVGILETEEDALEDLKKTAEDALSSTAEETEEATKKMEEFTVTIGDTTIEFKDAAAEVLKNADAYEKLQDSAQKIMDLDWSVFTEFEASLPNIEAGIGDMESSFVGLKDILEDNIGALENVRESVMDISEIAAPFLESGFLDGVKSIGNFAGALSDAGSAINTFSSLQDVSIDGCMNFSLHVRDMVSALEILESQMEDLVPSFTKMDSLITDIADAFLYSGGRGKETQDIISSTVKNAITDLESQGVSVDSLISKYNEYIEKGLSSNEALSKSFFDLGVSSREGFYGFFTLLDSLAGTDVGYDMADEFIAALEAGEDLDEWGNKYIHTADVITHQMDVQTTALKDQTGQLSKITDALQPYLEFMRTLNELAALSTLSTEELNAGLNSINDTLINLGTALSTFDLRPVMESLFGTEISPEEFTGGITTEFTDTMATYATPFSALIIYTERLSDSILTLVSSFEALANISESVLADQDKLKEVLDGMTDVMFNFNLAMGGGEDEWGFAQKIADGVDAMLKSATPLIAYFQKNNAAVELFNETLDTFASIIKTVTDAMDMLRRMSEMALPSVTELELGFDNTGKAISRFTEAMSTSFVSVKQDLKDLDKEWAKHDEGIDKLLESFGQAGDTISTLATKMVSLTDSLKELRDMSVLSVNDIDSAMQKIPEFLDNFVEALASNIGTIKKSLIALNEGWKDHAKEMEKLVPVFKDATDAINSLAGGVVSVVRSFESLKDVKFEEVFETGFKNLTKATAEFACALKNNIDGLLTSLNALVQGWLANEEETVYLMRAFMTISSNFLIVIGRANQLQKAFQSMDGSSKTLSEGFDELIGFMNGVIEGANKLYTTDVAADLAQFVIDVGRVIGALAKLETTINTAMGLIHTKIETTVNDAKNKVSVLSNIPASAYRWGADIIYSFVEGMKAMEFYLNDELVYLADLIAYYLGVGSNTKLGALSHLTDWPKNLVKTFADGIKKGTPEISKALSSLTIPAENLHIPGGYASILGGAGNTVTFYNTWNVDSQQNADYAISEMERMLTRKRVL